MNKLDITGLSVKTSKYAYIYIYNLLFHIINIFRPKHQRTTAESWNILAKQYPKMIILMGGSEAVTINYKD